MDTELLRQLSIIQNSYQDIEDALRLKPVDLACLKQANKRIGEAIKELLPE